MKKKYFIILSFFCLLSAEAAQAFSLSGFKNPESFIVDPEDGYYYVSNINGDPSEKDANGFISKISPNGNSVIQLFIGNYADSVLNAPKGLLVVGSDLYVADVDAVKVFDKRTGKLKATVDCSKLGAEFLNDIAADLQNQVYVSDTVRNMILSINPAKNYEAAVYAKGRDLGNPNGLRFNAKTKSLAVVTYGSGQILEIDRWKRIHVLKRGLSALDGIDYDNDGNLYVSSFNKGEIYKIPNYGRGTIITFASGLSTPADISCDRKKNEILIPLLKNGILRTQPLEKVKPAAPKT